MLRPLLYYALLFAMQFTITLSFSFLIENRDVYLGLAKSTVWVSFFLTLLIISRVECYNFSSLVKKTRFRLVLSVSLLAFSYSFTYPLLDFLNIVQNTPSYLSLGTSYSFKNIDVLMLITSLLLAPFLEEFFYRGYFLNELIKKINTFYSLIISSVIFALFHMDSQNFIIYFIMGIQLGAIYLFFKNLTLNILFHFIFNLLILYSESTNSNNIVTILVFSLSTFYIVMFNFFCLKKYNIRSFK